MDDGSAINFSYYYEYLAQEPKEKRFILPKVYILVWLWAIRDVSGVYLRRLTDHLKKEEI